MENEMIGGFDLASRRESIRQCVRCSGYGLCVAWGFLLYSIVEFHPGSGFGVFMWSTIPGCIACLVLLGVSRRVFVSDRRSALAFCAAALASVGTFLHVSSPWVGTWAQYAGIALAGVSFIGLLAPWFACFARLSARGVFLASGLALAAASVICVFVSVLDYEIAGLCLALLPVASALFLPMGDKNPVFGSEADGERSVFQMIKAAVPLKTLLGLLLVYFVIDSLRSIGRLPGSFLGIADATFLLAPFAISCACLLVACFARTRIDLGVLCKIILAAFSISLALIVVAVNPSFRFGFATSVCTQVLCWTLLVFVAKKSPVRAQIVFALGWVAEFIGGFLAQIIMPFAIPFGTAVPFALALLMATAAVFVFSDESLVVEMDCDDFPVDKRMTVSRNSIGYDAADGAATEPLVDWRDSDFAPNSGRRIAEFSQERGLTPRESEVFALWITGHGMKDIQEELFVSQGTVKTHLRNIYDKCGVHSRRDLMKLFEE